MSDRSAIPECMNKLSRAERISVLKHLLEGSSVSSTARLCDVSVPAILKLLVDVGPVCAAAHDRIVRKLSTKRVEVDELWAFIQKKEKNTDENDKEMGRGDSWTWIAIDPESKLVISYLVGDRSGDAAKLFIDDVAARLANRVQLTSDGYKPYLEAVEGAFGDDIDYSMLVKMYGNAPADSPEHKYSPGTCCGIRKSTITGTPDPRHISTSYVERNNKTIRMTDRRFTRLTDGHSKKYQNHVASVQLHFFAFNFCRIHRSIRMTPAMAAGVTDRIWEVGEIVDMLEAKERCEQEAKPSVVRGPRPYKPTGLAPIKVNGQRVTAKSDH